MRRTLFSGNNLKRFLIYLAIAHLSSCVPKRVAVNTKTLTNTQILPVAHKRQGMQVSPAVCSESLQYSCKARSFNKAALPLETCYTTEYQCANKVLNDNVLHLSNTYVGNSQYISKKETQYFYQYKSRENQKPYIQGIIFLAFADLLTWSWAVLHIFTPTLFVPVLLVLLLGLVFAITCRVINKYSINIDHKDIIAKYLKVLRIAAAILVVAGLVGFVIAFSAVYNTYFFKMLSLAILQVGVVTGLYSFLFNPDLSRSSIRSKKAVLREINERNFWVISSFSAVLTFLTIITLLALTGTGLLSFPWIIALALSVLLFLAFQVYWIGKLLGIIHLKPLKFKKEKPDSQPEGEG